MRAMRAVNHHHQERRAQTFPQLLEPAEKTTENFLFLKTNQQ